MVDGVPSGWTKRWLVLALFIIAPLSCVQDGYPLGPSGSVDIRVDIAGALYAADVLDSNGHPAGARQTPFASDVKLSITENNAPAFGALVTVRIEPSEALALSSAAAENTKDPSCKIIDGAFKCKATNEGLASFTVTSAADWSGPATIVVTWSNLKVTQPITILPAGLPMGATNFDIVGIDATDKVLATFVPLKCTVDAVPDDLGSKWREGGIRNRQVYVRATPPADAPTVVENAPVIVESLSPEAELDIDPSCADRTTRMRVQLQAGGQSPPFYVCFSDIGGLINLGVSSGQLSITPNPSVNVDPEPRLLRVAAIESTTPVSLSPVPLFEVSAYSANRVRIAVPVDLRIDAPSVLQLADVSVTLFDETTPATVIQATPKAAGTASLHVTPRLLSQPDCSSPLVTVTP